jgi:hypothetical protein
MVKFDLKNPAFLVFLWGILNLFNGLIVFNHDVLGSVGLQYQYYYLTGSVRMAIGIVALTIFIYLWITADDIVIFLRENGDK